MVDFTGTAGNDTLVGTADDDFFLGFDGNDVIRGEAGDDIIGGGNGDDVLIGGSGSDSMYGNDGNDVFQYENGMGADSGESADGGSGHDKIQVSGAGTFDLRELDALSIEEIQFDAADGINTVKTVQLGTAQLTDPSGFSPTMQIDGNSNTGSDDIVEIFVTSGVTTLDISGWTFQDWHPASENSMDTDEIKIFGSNVNDTITATSTDDEVHGGSGKDFIDGGAGHDFLKGDSEVDEIHGGEGNDIIEGGTGRDSIYGGDGNDILRILEDEWYDFSHGGNGIDTLDHSASTYTGNVIDFENGTMIGEGTGHVLIQMTGIEKYLDGSGSNTIISSGSGEYFGNGGDDLMQSDFGIESMDGGAGIDTIDHIGIFTDYTFDMFTGLTSNFGEKFTNFENVIMGNGDNTVTGNASDNVITLLHGDDVANGGDGDDYIDGGSGIDELYGEDGDDILILGFGSSDGGEIADGGNGSDTLDYSSIDGDAWNGNGWEFNLKDGTVILSGNQYATLVSIENVEGSTAGDILTGNAKDNILGGGLGDDTLKGNKGADTLRGDDGFDTLFGGKGKDVLNGGIGKDTLEGGKGKDTLNGGAGKDSLTGGKGVDTFVFDANNGKDTIQDFKNGTDLFDFSSFGFANKAEAKSHFFERGSAHNDVVGFEFDGTEIKIKGLDLGDINNADIII